MFKSIAFALAFLSIALPAASAKGTCERKSGHGWGPTVSLAQLQAFESIRLTTGNWPFSVDKVSYPSYRCRGADLDWSCAAHATVCKKF